MRKYKGMVWGCMPQGIKDVIEKLPQEGMMIYFENDWKYVEIYTSATKQFACWHENLDKPEGEELVGQWCKCRNEKTEEYREVARVLSYEPDRRGFPYETLHKYFQDVKPLSKELQEMLKKEVG